MQYVTESEKQAAIDSYCTHLCAQRMSLKINPSHCERRREMAGKATSALETYPGWECLECSGPIPRNPKPQTKEEQPMQTAAVDADRQRKYRCRECGDENPTHFYPSVRHLCKGHHNARLKEQRKRSHPGDISCPTEDGSTNPTIDQNNPTIPLSTTLPDPVTEPVEPDEAAVAIPTHICTVCGKEFGEFRRGAVIVRTICLDCIVSKTCETVRKRPEQVNSRVPNLVIYFQGEEDQELLSKLARTAKANRRSMADQVLFMVDRAFKEEKICFSGSSISEFSAF